MYNILSSINTKFGLDVVVLILLGSVDGGESEALYEGISANSLEDGGLNFQMEETSTFRTESCLHVKTPCTRASWQPFRICVVVWYKDLQRGHLEWTWYFQRERLSGVGKQSAPARSRKDSWPDGRSDTIWFHVRLDDSRVMISLNLLWTLRESSKAFQIWSTWCL